MPKVCRAVLLFCSSCDNYCPFISYANENEASVTRMNIGTTDWPIYSYLCKFLIRKESRIIKLAVKNEKIEYLN